MVSMERKISHIQSMCVNMTTSNAFKTWHQILSEIKHSSINDMLQEQFSCEKTNAWKDCSGLFMSHLSSSQANLRVICENKQSIGLIYSSHIQEKKHNLSMNSTAVLQVCVCGSLWSCQSCHPWEIVSWSR